MGNKKAPLN